MAVEGVVDGVTDVFLSVDVAVGVLLLLAEAGFAPEVGSIFAAAASSSASFP